MKCRCPCCNMLRCVRRYTFCSRFRLIRQYYILWSLRNTFGRETPALAYLVTVGRTSREVCVGIFSKIIGLIKTDRTVTLIASRCHVWFPSSVMETWNETWPAWISPPVRTWRRLRSSITWPPARSTTPSGRSGKSRLCASSQRLPICFCLEETLVQSTPRLIPSWRPSGTRCSTSALQDLLSRFVTFAFSIQAMVLGSILCFKSSTVGPSVSEDFIFRHATSLTIMIYLNEID